MRKINDYKIMQNDEGGWTVVGITGLKEEFIFNLKTETGISPQKLRETVETELKSRGIEIDECSVNVEFEEDMASIRKLMRSALNTLDDKSTTADQKNRELPIIQGQCLVSQTMMKTYALEIQRKQAGIKAKGIKANA